MKFNSFLLIGIAALGLLLISGCSPSEIKTPWMGKSADILQDDQGVTASPMGENTIKVEIKPKTGGESCTGNFEKFNSRSGIPLFIGAVSSYKGAFDRVSTEECQKAIGGNGGIVRYIDIRDPALFGSTILIVCNTDSSEKLCFAVNTFRIKP